MACSRDRNHPVVVALGSAAVMALALAGGAREASASPSSRLVFARGRGAEGCPDERALRAAVAARVGYDPFFPHADRTVLARLDAGQGTGETRVRARMEIVDDRGAILGEKTFTSTDCDELVRTLALAISLAIDVDGRASPPAAPAAATEPQREAASPPPATHVEATTHAGPVTSPPAAAERPASDVNEGTRSGGELWFTGRSSIGIGPGPSPGLAAGAALRRGSWSLGVEGRFDPGAGGDLQPRGSLVVSLLAGSVVACLHGSGSRSPGSEPLRWLFGCAVVTAGRLEAGSRGILAPATDTATFLAAGARLGAELEATRALAFRVALDASVAPLRHEARVGEASVFRTSPVVAALGASAVVRF